MKRFYITLAISMGIVSLHAQNIGISNDAAFTTPQSPLHIYWTADGNLLQLSRSSAANTGLTFSVSSNDYSILNRQNNALIFGTNATECMRIFSSGAVRIGYGTAATDALQVGGYGTTNPTVFIGAEGGAPGYGRIGLYGTSYGTFSTILRGGGLSYFNSGNQYVFGQTTAVDANDFVGIVGNATYPWALNAYTNQANAGAIYGANTAATGAGTGSGVYGISLQTGASGVVGDGSSNTRGVLGINNNDTYAAVQAQNANAGGDALFAYNTAANGSGTGTAIWAYSGQTGASTICASLQSNTYFSKAAISAFTINTLAGGTGVIGACDNATGVGVQGQSAGSTGIGVAGFASAANVTAIGIYGVNTGVVNGTGFLTTTCRKAIYGQENNLTANYAFGVYGSGGNGTRSGGVIGHNNGANFYSAGALGYYTSGNQNVAVYGFSGTYTIGAAGGYLQQQNDDNLYANLSTKGGPKMQNNFKSSLTKDDDDVNFSSWSNQEPNNMIGLGIYGGVMGGWIKGLVYGANFSGAKYGVYVHGKTLTNNFIATLNEVDGSDNRIATFAPSAMKVDVNDRGKAKLINGKATVEFDKNFAKLISEEEPVTITVTPLGSSKGLYIEHSSTSGFSVVENDGGNSNVEFNWIAIAVKKGFEKPSISPEILASDFEEKMNGNEGVMYNDNNPAPPLYSLWYDGKQVRFDKPPASLTDRKPVAPIASYRTPLNKENKKNEIITLPTNKTFFNKNK
jgi:hypothetical protein